MDRIGYHNNVEYTLISKSQGRVVIDEPIKYDDGNGNIYTRDPKGKGFIKSRKDSLEFYGSGFQALITQTSTKGIAEDMALEKIEKDRTRLDEEWRGFPLDYLDLGTLQYDEKDGGTGIAKVKTTQGGIRKIIDSKLSDELDLTALTDINGNVIDPLETDTIFLEPKEILLRSKMTVDDGTVVSASVGGGIFGSGEGLNARSFPFKFDPNSDKENLGNPQSDQLSAQGTSYANLSGDKQGNVFLIEATTNKVLKLNGKVKLTQSGTPHPGTFSLDIVIYSGGSDYIFKEAISLDTCNPNVFGDICEFTFVDYPLLVEAGESVAIGTLSDTADGINFTITETSVEITESSGQFETASNSRCLTYKATLERLLYMLTGEKIEVESKLLSTGELAEDVILNGFWARQFPDIIQEGTDEERKIQFKTSLKKITQHIETLIPMAYWVETINDKEVLRVEELKHTQQNFIGVPFCKTVTDALGNAKKVYPQASKIKRKLTKKDFFSKIELGSQKGGEDYEEVYGLQSVSGRATFSTVNSNNEAVYSRLSPYRLGDVDVELPRRKPYEFFPEEDTRYDSDITAIRAKKLNGKFYVKKWQDSYEIAPTGVYGVDSAYNFEFSPAQLLLKHGFVIKAGVYHYPDSNIVFAESNCNSSLVTKKAGEDELRESPHSETGLGVIPVSRLENPRVRPQTMDCTLQVTQEIEDYINDYTNGVPNVFGLIEVNTGITIEYFRMVKTDANEDGKHKFIEAFIT